MGNESKTISGETKPSTNKGSTDNGHQGSTGHSPTATTEGGRGGRGGRGTDTAATKQGEKALGLPVLVEEPKDVPVRLPEGAKPPTRKKKKKPVTKVDVKEVATKETKNQLSLLLLAVSEIASLRGGELWKLTPSEAESISNPLGNILSKHDLVSKANEYGDYIALATALGMVVVPRVLLAKEAKKTKMEGVPVLHVQKQEVKSESRESEKPSRSVDESSPRRVSPDARQFFSGFEQPVY